MNHPLSDVVAPAVAASNPIIRVTLPFARNLAAGTEIVYDPLTKQYLPFNVAFPAIPSIEQQSALGNTGHYRVSWTDDNEIFVVTQYEQDLEFHIANLHTQETQYLSSHTVSVFGTGGNYEIIGFVKAASNRWMMMVEHRSVQKYALVDVQWDGVSLTVTDKTIYNNGDYKNGCEFVLLDDGNVLGVVGQTANEAFVVDPADLSHTLHTFPIGSANAPASNSRHFRVFSDGNILMRGSGGSAKIYEWTGSAFNELQDYPNNTLHSGVVNEFARAGTDEFLFVSRDATSEELVLQRVTYSPATNSLSVYEYPTRLMEGQYFSAPPDVAIYESGKLFAIDGNDYVVCVDYDPVTKEIDFDTAVRFESFGFGQFEYNSGFGSVFCARRDNEDFSPTLVSAFRLATLLDDMRPIRVGQTIEDETTADISLWVTAPTYSIESATPDTIIGDYAMLTDSLAVRLDTTESVLSRFTTSESTSGTGVYQYTQDNYNARFISFDPQIVDAGKVFPVVLESDAGEIISPRITLFTTHESVRCNTGLVVDGVPINHPRLGGGQVLDISTGQDHVHVKDANVANFNIACVDTNFTDTPIVYCFFDEKGAK